MSVCPGIYFSNTISGLNLSFTDATIAANNKKPPSHICKGGFGWLMGLEPTTLGTTNQYSNQLSYSHRIF